MCGVFIPDRVLAGWWRGGWEAGDGWWVGRGKTGGERGGGIAVVYWVDVSFS